MDKACVNKWCNVFSKFKDQMLKKYESLKKACKVSSTKDFNKMSEFTFET